MLERQRRRDRTEVTLVLSADTPPGSVSAVGDVNEWRPGTHGPAPRPAGPRAVMATLPAKAGHSFRHLAACDYWFNGDIADDHDGNSRLMKQLWPAAPSLFPVRTEAAACADVAKSVIHLPDAQGRRRVRHHEVAIGIAHRPAEIGFLAAAGARRGRHGPHRSGRCRRDAPRADATAVSASTVLVDRFKICQGL
ncbi:hypothetical protein ACFWBC_13165 [Streptomyces sp. NPDC059985]|uniref:hypothetical protein n=1 Tax=Streptomyces sp. NPDC059985 TaxID=3347025 RepID=UPI003675E149